MSGKILVLGATGHVGVPLVASLVEAGHGGAVKAASRSGAAVGGVAGVRFDFSDPSTFDAAFEGVDRLFLLAPTGTVDPVATLLPLVETARARGVKIVFMSAFGVDADDAIPYRRVELAIMKAGVPHVILRPNWFADNFHIFWKAGIDRGAIAVPAGDGKSSFIDTRDIAASIAAALTTDRFDGRAFDLTGPAALGYGEAAAILSETMGRPIAYTAVDDATFVGILTGAGVPADYAGFMATLFHPVREGWTARVTDGVETLTGRVPRDLATYARDNRAKLGGRPTGS